MRQPDKWEFSFFGGFGSLAGDNTFVTRSEAGGSNEVRMGRDGGFVFGLRISENLKQHFGAELEYTYSGRDFDFLNLSPALGRFEMQQAIHNISYNGLFYLRNRQHRMRPYATAGVGASFYQLRGDTEARGVAVGLDLQDQWKFAVSFGGGVKFLFRNRWGVRFDFRDQVSGVPHYGVPREAMSVNGIVGPAFRPDGLFHNVHVSAGLLYTFNPR